MESDFSKKIIGILAPSMGEFMAKGSVLAACKKAGVDISNLEKSKSIAVISNLQRLLEMKFGSESAKNLIAKIKSL